MQTRCNPQSPKKVGIVEGQEIDADRDLAEAKAAAEQSRASTRADPSSAEEPGSAKKLSPADVLPLINLVGEGCVDVVTASARHRACAPDAVNEKVPLHFLACSNANLATLSSRSRLQQANMPIKRIAQAESPAALSSGGSLPPLGASSLPQLTARSASGGSTTASASASSRATRTGCTRCVDRARRLRVCCPCFSASPLGANCVTFVSLRCLLADTHRCASCPGVSALCLDPTIR